MGLGITTPALARTRRTAEVPGSMYRLLDAAPSAAVPLLSSVHWFDCVVSENFKRPIVREESRLTVVSAVMFSVEKSARLEAPSAMMPPDHLIVSLHNPLVVEVQVPFAAFAAPAA